MEWFPLYGIDAIGVIIIVEIVFRSGHSYLLLIVMWFPAECMPAVIYGSSRRTIHEITCHWINLPAPRTGADATPNKLYSRRPGCGLQFPEYLESGGA